MPKTKKLPWLRLHTEIVDDPKMASLSGDEFRVWVYLMCMARESYAPGTIGMDAAGIAWRMRLPNDLVERSLAKFESSGMIRRDALTVSIAKWEARQYEKPSDTPRESRKRKRKERDKGVTAEPGHAHVTPTSRVPSVQSRTDTEQNRPEQNDAAPPPAPLVCSPEAVVGAWNTVCGDVLPKVSKITPGRRDKVRVRCREDAARVHGWWTSYFGRIRHTPFLTGENDRGWKADFDWAVESESNVVKVLEGKYERAGPKKPVQPDLPDLNVAFAAKRDSA